MQMQKLKKIVAIKTRKTTGLRCFTYKYHNDSLIPASYNFKKQVIVAITTQDLPEFFRDNYVTSSRAYLLENFQSWKKSLKVQ